MGVAMRNNDVKFDKKLIQSFLKTEKPDEKYYDNPLPDLAIKEESSAKPKDYEQYFSNFEVILAQACSACVAAQAAPTKETKRALDILKEQVIKGIEFFVPIECQVKVGRGDYHSGYDDYDQPYSYYDSTAYKKEIFHLDGTYYPEYVKYNFIPSGESKEGRTYTKHLINDILVRGAEVAELIDQTQASLENAASKQRQ